MKRAAARTTLTSAHGEDDPCNRAGDWHTCRVSRTTWALLLTLSIGPSVLGLTNDVQDVDPAQYADVARRMLASGDWLHLADQNGPFWNKPPLTMWLQAAGMAVFGVDALAVRLPGLLFAVITMVSTFWIGRLLVPKTMPAAAAERRGLTAAVLVGSALSSHLMVLDPKVDTALTAMTSAAIALMIGGRTKPWLRLLAWAVAGLAVLSKGPIGLGIPVIALLPEVVRPGWSEGGLLRRLWSVWPFGLILTGLVAAPFYSAMHTTTGDEGVLYLLWYQGFGRLWGQAGFLDDTTPLFFTHTMLWAFLPFSPLVVLSLVRRAADLVRTRALPPNPGRVPAWWFLLTFAVISVSTYKLPQYLYPLTPAAALLATEELERLEARVATKWRWLFTSFSVVVVLFVAVVFAVAFPANLGRVAAWGGVALLPVVALTRWARRLPVADGVVASLALCLGGLMAFLAGYLQPATLAFQPSRELGALVQRVDPQSRVLPVVFAWPLFSYSFYAQRDAKYLMPDGLRGVVDRGEAKVAIIGPDGSLDALTAEGLSYEVLGAFSSFSTSRPSPSFLRASTRPSTLSEVKLVRVWLAAPR